MADERFPSPGTDVRFSTPGEDLEHAAYPADARFTSPGTDTRFQGGYAPVAPDTQNAV
jgi:hypothetical protein